jgi:hypothetical protein
MSKTLGIALAASLVVGLLVMMIDPAWPFLCELVAHVAFVTAALSWAIGILSMKRFGGQPRERRAVIPAFAVASVAQSCLIAFQVSPGVRADLSDARIYCARLGALLEQYKKLNGSYPSRLSLVPLDEPLPRLLRGRDFYSSWGQYYQFSVIPPHGRTQYFDSVVGLWREADTD